MWNVGDSIQLVLIWVQQRTVWLQECSRTTSWVLYACGFSWILLTFLVFWSMNFCHRLKISCTLLGLHSSDKLPLLLGVLYWLWTRPLEPQEIDLHPKSLSLKDWLAFSCISVDGKQVVIFWRVWHISERSLNVSVTVVCCHCKTCTNKRQSAIQQFFSMHAVEKNKKKMHCWQLI